MGKKYIIEIIGGEEGDMDFSTIEPYTEPDTDSIRKEAYEQGINDAREGKASCQFCEYEMCSDRVDPCRICACNYTNFFEPKKQEKEEQIQVGDEIETPSGLKGYVVNFTDDELVHYVSSEGRFGTMGTSAVSKTGRHFPEIAEVLQKMKES